MLKKNTKTRAGFTILELLIALAITAMLLSTIAVVFNASVKNYIINKEMLLAINNTRQALSRMTTQIRTAYIDPNSPPNECSLITADGEDITYRYDSSENKLLLTDNTSGSDYLLCDDVTAMTFTRQPGIDDEGTTFVKSVQISITVTCGNVEQKLSAAAVVRRNLK